MRHIFPASGWLPEGAHFEWNHSDQGEDIVTDWRGTVQAPGEWRCTEVRWDYPFPRGFGPAFPLVRISSGPFAHPLPYYIGHCTSLVRVGDSGHFGSPLAKADQGQDFAGTHGGWIELGQAMANDRLGPEQSWGHWYKPLLLKSVEIDDPPLKFGDSGWRVVGVTSNLAACGYLRRRYWRFGRDVHGAVVRFKEVHRLPMPAPGGADRGVVDVVTDVAIKHAADWCRAHHHPEVKP